MRRNARGLLRDGRRSPAPHCSFTECRIPHRGVLYNLIAHCFRTAIHCRGAGGSVLMSPGHAALSREAAPRSLESGRLGPTCRLRHHHPRPIPAAACAGHAARAQVGGRDGMRRGPRAPERMRSMQRHGIFGTVGVLLVTLALVACGRAATTPGATGGAEETEPAATGAQPTEPADTDPIVVGSTLPLTGALAATGVIHQIAGEQFIARLNESGGLLGRQVEWTVFDDESDQANVATLYERLITEEEVDLIMGPYATPFIISAMAIAERHGYVMPQHTAVLAPLMTYECQFPGWSIGPTPNEFVPEQLYEALATLDSPPQSIVFVTNQSGSTDFITHGQADVEDPDAISIAEEAGLEVLADIGYPPGNDDWSAIAAQIRDLSPDFVMMNSLGVESVGLVEAMEQLGYRPPLMFSLFPAPGPLLGLGEAGENHLSVSTFTRTARRPPSTASSSSTRSRTTSGPATRASSRSRTATGSWSGRRTSRQRSCAARKAEPNGGI